MPTASLLRRFGVSALVLSLLLLHGCGSQSPAPQQGAGSRMGSVFLVGTDAPLGSVVAFRITFTGLAASDGTNTVSLLSAPQEVEFARLNGLRTLLGVESAPVGSYSRITLTLAAPVISFLDFSVTPPAVSTLEGQLVRSSVTVDLPQPLVITEDELVGLFLDFRIGASVEVDAGGQMTGRVDPRIVVRAVPPDAPEAEIHEIRGGVSSVDLAAGTFVMQLPHGRTLAVLTGPQTEFAEGEGLATFDANTIVEVSGTLERNRLRLRAGEVQVLSRTRFLLAGLLTHVRPAPGRADEVDLFVRTELPDLPGTVPGRIATLGFDDNERFAIHHLRLPLAHLLFNRASLTPGQRVSIGGALENSALDVRRVTLHVQGLDGRWVPGSTRIESGTTGGFHFHAAGIAGRLFERPVRVFTSERTRFVNLRGLEDLSGDAPLHLRVVGLVLLDHLTNDQVVVAAGVELLR